MELHFLNKVLGLLVPLVMTEFEHAQNYGVLTCIITATVAIPTEGSRSQLEIDEVSLQKHLSWVLRGEQELDKQRGGRKTDLLNSTNSIWKMPYGAASPV